MAAGLSCDSHLYEDEVNLIRSAISVWPFEDVAKLLIKLDTGNISDGIFVFCNSKKSI